MQVGRGRQDQINRVGFKQIAGFPGTKIGIHKIQIDDPHKASFCRQAKAILIATSVLPLP